MARVIAKAELTGTIGRILPVVDNGEETMLGKLTSAVSIIAKAELTGGLGRILPTSPHGEEVFLGNLMHEEGIGWRTAWRPAPRRRDRRAADRRRATVGKPPPRFFPRFGSHLG
jgi:hypothetical protein